MTMRVFLKGSEVKTLADFTEKPRSRGSQEWTEYGVPGLKLCNEKGRWYTILELGDQIPAVIKELVEEITLREWFFGARRETGFYTHNSATAEVEWDDEKINVSASAKKMDDLIELVQKIREGTIRPEKSYEGPQGGPSYAELDTALKSVNEQCKEISAKAIKNSEEICLRITQQTRIADAATACVAMLQADLEALRAKYEQLVELAKNKARIAKIFDCLQGDLRMLCDDRADKDWPLCLNKTVVREIREIINRNSDIKSNPPDDGAGLQL